MSSLGLPYPQLGGEYATLGISTHCDIKTQVNGPIVIWCLHNKLGISIHISQWATVLFSQNVKLHAISRENGLKKGGTYATFSMLQITVVTHEIKESEKNC